MVALLAVLLIGSGALAVDLGNAFARKRISQTQADLAALAGAAQLPASDPTSIQKATDAAWDYLIRNEVIGQDSADLGALKQTMTNGIPSDGEICVGDLTSTSCVANPNLISVLTPDAQVDYALGGVFNQNGIDVQAYAQAGIFSPGKIAPFFIPYGCSTPLPTQIFVKSGAQSTPTDPTPQLWGTGQRPGDSSGMAGKNGTPAVDTVVPAQIGFGATPSSRPLTDVRVVAGDVTLTSTAANFSYLDIGADVVVDDVVFTPSGVPRSATGSMSNGSAVLTSATASFTVGDVNQQVVVERGKGNNNPLTTTIASVQSPTQATLAAPALANVNNRTITITPGTLSDLTTTIAGVTSATQATLAPAPVPGLDKVDATAVVTQPSTLRVEVTGQGFVDAGDGVASMVVAFVRGAQSYEVTVQGDDITRNKYSNPQRDSLMVTVPEEVLSLADSRWYIQVRSSAGTTWSYAEDQQNDAILEISSSADPGDQCGERVTGDFGLLNSPRSDANQLGVRLNLNIAEGLDHAVQEFPGPTPLTANGTLIDPTDKDNCRISPQTSITGAILDDEASVASGKIPNCMEINNGNKVDDTTDGLITGGTNPRAYDGRLESGPTTPCARSNYLRLGTSVNNDVLSCFLEQGNILAAVNGTGPKFRSQIIDSPRFMFVPVLWANVNPQNGYYPIERFAAAFITDEIPQTEASTGGQSTATADNGIPTTNTKVQGIEVIPFELSRLPEQVDYNGQVIPYIGAGPKVVRLIR